MRNFLGVFTYSVFYNLQLHGKYSLEITAAENNTKFN